MDRLIPFAIFVVIMTLLVGMVVATVLGEAKERTAGESLEQVDLVGGHFDGDVIIPKSPVEAERFPAVQTGGVDSEVDVRIAQRVERSESHSVNISHQEGAGVYANPRGGEIGGAENDISFSSSRQVRQSTVGAVVPQRRLKQSRHARYIEGLLSLQPTKRVVNPPRLLAPASRESVDRALVIGAIDVGPAYVRQAYRRAEVLSDRYQLPPKEADRLRELLVRRAAPPAETLEIDGEERPQENQELAEAAETTDDLVRAVLPQEQLAEAEAKWSEKDTWWQHTLTELMDRDIVPAQAARGAE